jgi:hypothetical protein
MRPLIKAHCNWQMLDFTFTFDKTGAALHFADFPPDLPE